jgi:hypothetical protein
MRLMVVTHNRYPVSAATEGKGELDHVAYAAASPSLATDVVVNEHDVHAKTIGAPWAGPEPTG